MDDLGISTGSLVVRLFGFDYIFQIHFTNTDPQLFKKFNFLTVNMDVNSPQPTILCVVKFCVFLSILYDQDSPFLEFVVLLVVVVVSVIVVGNQLLGMDWSVLIPLGTIDLTSHQA